MTTDVLQTFAVKYLRDKNAAKFVAEKIFLFIFLWWRLHGSSLGVFQQISYFPVFNSKNLFYKQSTFLIPTI
jgi:hypothetical protein